ncbi:MAG: Grx4 family monothiol glutaredoxin [Polyangiaceae bacterium]
MTEEQRKFIDETVNSKRIVLFMKGNRAFPRCGFSGKVVDILERHDADFLDIDVLGNPELRDVLKEYSNWPTFPQLFVEGKLVGGCDIVTDLDSTGQLAEILTSSAS